MALKPDPHTAVLVKERVQEVLHGGNLATHEQIALEEFDRDLEHYLQQ